MKDEKKNEDHPAIAFLKTLFNYCENGFLDCRFINKETKTPIEEFIPLNKVQDLARRLRFYRNTHNCYFSPATRAKRDGHKEAILQVSSLWLDLDQKDFPSTDEYKKAVGEVVRFHLKPAFVIQTGGGGHFYWMLKEPVSNADIPKVENLLKRLASRFQGDRNSTDASHILRIPGSLNFKYTPAREVKLVFSQKEGEHNEYSLEDFDNLLLPEEEAPREDRHYTQEVNERLNQIMQCEFLKHCDVNKKTLSESEWYRMVMILCREQGGPSLIHRLSIGYPGYSPQETKDKIIHAMDDSGPTTCQYIKNELKFDCKKDCGVTSPVQLAHGGKLKKEEISKHLEEMIESLTPESYSDNWKELFEKLFQLSEVERDLKFKTIAKKIGVSKTSVKNDFNSSVTKKGENANVDELLERCVNGCKVYTAQNYYDGVLSYGVVIGDTKLVVESTGNVIQSSTEVNMKFTRTKLTKEAIKRFRDGEDVNGKELHGRLSRLFSDHAIFTDPRIPDLLATWVIGTYMYKSFPYYGYLLFVSPVKRCGKSRAEELLSQVCHNATPLLVNPSEASVFRQVDGDDITMIIDEVESLSPKEKDKKIEMFSLLNSGFQKGSTVTRIESRGKEFIVSSFNAYGPKVLAGIKGVNDTLEDRSFKIPMIRKSPGEKIKRFNVRLQEDEVRQLRDDLYIFGFRHGRDVIELYDLMTGKIPEMEGFDDRQKDILEPLACIDLVIDELANDKDRATFNTLIELSKDMSLKRISHEKLDGDMTAMFKVLEGELDGVEESFIPISKLLEAANATGEFSFKHTRGLGRYMAKLDIYSDQKKIEGKNIRGYTITKAWLEDQKKRYIL